MSGFFSGINNGANTPVIYQNTDANRPTAPLAVGSLFVSQTSNILQRWDGSGWVTVGGGAGATPTLQQVTDQGSTTSNSITITNTNGLSIQSAGYSGRFFVGTNGMYFQDVSAGNEIVLFSNGITLSPAGSLPVFVNNLQTTGSSGIAIKNSAGVTVANFGSAATTNISLLGAVSVSGVLSVNVTTQAQALFRGYSSVTGNSSFNNGVFLLGENVNFQGRVDYDGNGIGRLYFINTYDHNASSIWFRLRSSGAPIDPLKIEGTNVVNVTNRLLVGSGSVSNSVTLRGGGIDVFAASGTSLIGTLTGTGTNVGAQWKFVSDNNTTGAFIGIAAGEATGDAVFAVGANKKLVFGIGSAGNSRAAEIDNNSVKIFQTAGNTSNWLSIGAVGTGTNTWLFGSATSGSGFTLKTDAYLNVTHNGTAFKLALVN